MIVGVRRLREVFLRAIDVAKRRPRRHVVGMISGDRHEIGSSLSIVVAGAISSIAIWTSANAL